MAPLAATLSPEWNLWVKISTVIGGISGLVSMTTLTYLVLCHGRLARIVDRIAKGKEVDELSKGQAKAFLHEHPKQTHMLLKAYKKRGKRTRARNVQQELLSEDGSDDEHETSQEEEHDSLNRSTFLATGIARSSSKGSSGSRRSRRSRKPDNHHSDSRPHGNADGYESIDLDDDPQPGPSKSTERRLPRKPVGGDKALPSVPEDGKLYEGKGKGVDRRGYPEDGHEMMPLGHDEASLLGHPGSQKSGKSTGGPSRTSTGSSKRRRGLLGWALPSSDPKLPDFSSKDH